MNTSKKFHVGKYTEGYENSKGWFVGSYLPDNLAQTDQVELIYKNHNPGDEVAYHRHDKKIEIGLMLEGKAEVTIEGEVFTIQGGDFYFLEKGTASSIKFLEPTKFIAIHSPCVPSDKIIL